MFNSNKTPYYSSSNSSNPRSNPELFGESRSSIDSQYWDTQQSSASQRQRRPSVNETSDDYSKPRRTSVGGGTGNTRRQLNPPCRPATVAMLYMYRNNETGIVKLHGSSDSCAVSLVGWVYPKSARLTSGESEFSFSDGSGRIIVRVDIPSEQEIWLLPHMEKLVMGNQEGTTEGQSSSKDDGDDGKKVDDEAPVMYRYLRLIADVTQELDQGHIVVRAIHLRLAQPSEAAYHHPIECMVIKLQLTAASTATTTTLESLSELLDGVDLADCYKSDVTDPHQLLVLKYITKYRKEECGGVTLLDLENKLSCAMSKGEFEAALKELQNSTFIDTDSVEGTVDIV